MDDLEEPGQHTELRAHLLRAIEAVTGKPARMMGKPAVAMSQVGELFGLLNMHLPPEQLARLCKQKEERHRRCGPREECFHLGHALGLDRPRLTHQPPAHEESLFSLHELHWCVLESLRATRSISAALRQRIIREPSLSQRPT